jgi:hypothetical protein
VGRNGLFTNIGLALYLLRTCQQELRKRAAPFGNKCYPIIFCEKFNQKNLCNNKTLAHVESPNPDEHSDLCKFPELVIGIFCPTSTCAKVA